MLPARHFFWAVKFTNHDRTPPPILIKNSQVEKICQVNFVLRYGGVFCPNLLVNFDSQPRNNRENMMENIYKVQKIRTTEKNGTKNCVTVSMQASSSTKTQIPSESKHSHAVF